MTNQLILKLGLSILPVIIVMLFLNNLIPYWHSVTMHGLEDCIPKGAKVTDYTTANCGIECYYYVTITNCSHIWVPVQ